MLAIEAVAMPVLADADAPLCITPNELHADKTRFVETQLRIATLQCRGQGHAEILAMYNEFVLANRPYFVAAQPTLKRFVVRARKGTLEQYVIAVANKISLASMATSQFCVKAGMALELSKKLPEPSSLYSLMAVKYLPPAQSCVPK